MSSSDKRGVLCVDDDPAMLELLQRALRPHYEVVRVAEMTAAMTLENDAKTKTGVVIVPAGKQLTSALLERLMRFSRSGVLVESLRVRVPL